MGAPRRFQVDRFQNDRFQTDLAVVALGYSFDVRPFKMRKRIKRIIAKQPHTLQEELESVFEQLQEAASAREQVTEEELSAPVAPERLALVETAGGKYILRQLAEISDNALQQLELIANSSREIEYLLAQIDREAQARIGRRRLLALAVLVAEL